MFSGISARVLATQWRNSTANNSSSDSVVLYEYIVYKYTASQGDASIGEVEGARQCGRSGLLGRPEVAGRGEKNDSKVAKQYRNGNLSWGARRIGPGTGNLADCLLPSPYHRARNPGQAAGAGERQNLRDELLAEGVQVAGFSRPVHAVGSYSLTWGDANFQVASRHYMKYLRFSSICLILDWIGFF